MLWDDGIFCVYYNLAIYEFLKRWGSIIVVVNFCLAVFINHNNPNLLIGSPLLPSFSYSPVSSLQFPLLS
jgi:hypothetical protein